MKGIILAGGQGTRLRPMTTILNKHLLPVYDKPMIEYPLRTLIDLGCNDIMLICGGEHIGGFANYLQNGSRYGVRITYRVQPTAGGVAQALLCAEGFTNDYELFPVILGDNYFEKPVKLTSPGIIVKSVEEPNRFGVYTTEDHQIVEKPEQTNSSLAVTGLYWYDFKIYSLLARLQPSARGELEITDLNNIILQNGGIAMNYDGFWSDMGTTNTLLEVANYVKNLNN